MTTSESRKTLGADAMLLFQFLRQCSTFIEVCRERYGSAQFVGEWRFAVAAVFPILRHHAQLAGDDFGHGRVMRPRFFFREMQNGGVQWNSQCPSHARKLRRIIKRDKAAVPMLSDGSWRCDRCVM